MTLIEHEGFDLRDFALPLPGWTSVLGATNTTTPFGSGSSWAFTESAVTPQSATYSFTAVSKIFCGMACSLGASSNFGVVIFGDAGVTTHLTLVSVTGTGVLNLFRGTTAGTLLASSASGALPNDGVFRYLEVSAVVSDTVGTFEAKVNGVSVLTFSGDTKNAGTNSTIDAIKIGWVGTGSNGPLAIVDDFYLCSDAGGGPDNTYLGPWARVQTLKPSGAGSSTQFTPLSGSNFSNVNDVPDNTATYNSDTVSGHRDTFALDDLTAGTTTVYAVKQIMHGRQLDGGTATIKQAQKSGASVSYGTTKTLTPSNAAYRDYFLTNPATGLAYTVSEINALEAGYENV